MYTWWCHTGWFVGGAAGRINQARQSFHCRCPSRGGSLRSRAGGFGALCVSIPWLWPLSFCVPVFAFVSRLRGRNKPSHLLPKSSQKFSCQFACTGTVLHPCTSRITLDVILWLWCRRCIVITTVRFVSGAESRLCFLQSVWRLSVMPGLWMWGISGWQRTSEGINPWNINVDDYLECTLNNERCFLVLNFSFLGSGEELGEISNGWCSTWKGQTRWL